MLVIVSAEWWSRYTDCRGCVSRQIRTIHHAYIFKYPATSAGVRCARQGLSDILRGHVPISETEGSPRLDRENEALFPSEMQDITEMYCSKRALRTQLLHCPRELNDVLAWSSTSVCRHVRPLPKVTGNRPLDTEASFLADLQMKLVHQY